MKLVHPFLSAVCCSTNTNQLASWFDSLLVEEKITLPQQLQLLNEKYAAYPPLTPRKYYDTPLNLALHTSSHLSVVSSSNKTFLSSFSVVLFSILFLSFWQIYIWLLAFYIIRLHIIINRNIIYQLI